MSKPFFSIVTAVKDQLGFLKETASTVLNQTFEDWEWIVVDDGSEEPVSDYLLKLKDPRIFVFRNEKCERQTKSLNFGIKKANANWIVRVDADDLLYPSRLQKTFEVIESFENDPTKCPLIFSDYDVALEDGSLLTSIHFRTPIDEEFYSYLRTKNNLICHPSVTFFKKAPSGEIYQYDESLKNAQDYALWKRILADHGERFYHISDTLIRYRLVRDSLSGAWIEEQKNELIIIQGKKPKRIFNSDQVKKILSLKPNEKEGMYAFRTLYYSFVGSLRSKAPKLKTLAKTLQYPPVLAKSFFYYGLWPFRSHVKPILFNRIYK
ncbi:MAG: glycosyltransferase [Bacteriovoracia bacterium]